MEYEDALRYMHGRLRLGVKLGNERFSALLERLGSPHRALRVIHVAGTKGKGSTTAMAARILQAAGYKVGHYLSPYVYNVRERVQVNGRMISEADFARWVTRIKPHVEALEGTDLGPTTEFELKTAVGLCYFAEQAVDYAVVEVGLGGRLDATNVFARPLATVITNIGFDHMEMLGDTLGKIAWEKAGIVKPSVPCVTGVPSGGEADAVIAAVCRERSAPLQHVSSDLGSPAETHYEVAADGLLTITTPQRRIDCLRLALHGAFQHGNAAVAVAALDAVAPESLPPVTDDAIRQGLESAYVPGRLEQVADRPTVVLDGAHNEMAAQALAAALRSEYAADRRRLILVVGLKRNHDPETFLGPLAALHPAALVAAQPSFHPCDAQEVAAAARRCDIPQIALRPSSVEEAVHAALALAGPDDLVCVTGSFYIVGDLPPSFWETLSKKPLLSERN
jgi:dihydrofolate synthase/folylpolyglutamate synthase